LVWGDEVILEIKKVIWPSRKDTVAMSIVVVVMVIISGLIVSSFDFISGYLINFMMK
jgi:preprotein translocase subunit SecE